MHDVIVKYTKISADSPHTYNTYAYLKKTPIIYIGLYSFFIGEGDNVVTVEVRLSRG